MKRQVIKNILNYSGCMFFIEARSSKHYASKTIYFEILKNQIKQYILSDLQTYERKSERNFALGLL